MEFIDNSRFPGMTERLIALPIKIRVSDDALGRGSRIIGFRERQVLLRRRGIIAKGRKKIAAANGCDRGRIRIYNELVRIEAVPSMRSVGSGETESVELSRFNPLQPNVPDVARLVPGGVEQDAPGWHGILVMIEEIEANA